MKKMMCVAGIFALSSICAAFGNPIASITFNGYIAAKEEETTFVFAQTTIAALSECEFSGIMGGAWVNSGRGQEAKGYHKEYKPGESLRVQFQCIDKGDGKEYVKCVRVVFRDEPGGVSGVCDYSGFVTRGYSKNDIGYDFRDDANWVSVSQMPWSSTRMEGVKGAVELVVDGSRPRTVALDDKWRAAVFPVSGERFALDKVPFDGKTRFRVADTKPGERVALSRIALRFDCEAVVYAAKPGPVTFSVLLRKVNNRGLKGGGDFVVRDMSGGKVAKLPAPDERMSDRTFDAPAAGFYRISCHVRPHAVVFGECDAPIGFMPPKDGLDFYKSVGDLWFAHTPRGDATFFCGGTGEPANIALYGPEGDLKEQWADQRDWGFVRIAPEAPKGLWRVHLSRPKGPGHWEDTMLDLTGVPAVFFLSKEKFWVSLVP